jgi:hypothetical protein
MQYAVQARCGFERACRVNLDAIRFEIPRSRDELCRNPFTAIGIEQTPALRRRNDQVRDPFGHAFGRWKETRFRG